jgi:hypothetical protein
MPRKAKTPVVQEVAEPVAEPIVEPVQQVQEVLAPKEKKKRNLNPDTMTYIKALAIWKEGSGKKGISPKKGSGEYDEVMKILRERQAKKE